MQPVGEMDTEAPGKGSFSDPKAIPPSWACGYWSRWPLPRFTAVVCLCSGPFTLLLIIHQWMCMNTNPCFVFFYSLAVAWPCSANRVFSLCSSYWKKLSPFSEHREKYTGMASFFSKYCWQKGRMNMNFTWINWSMLVQIAKVEKIRCSLAWT